MIVKNLKIIKLSIFDIVFKSTPCSWSLLNLCIHFDITIKYIFKRRTDIFFNHNRNYVLMYGMSVTSSVHIFFFKQLNCIKFFNYLAISKKHPLAPIKLLFISKERMLLGANERAFFWWPKQCTFYSLLIPRSNIHYAHIPKRPYGPKHDSDHFHLQPEIIFFWNSIF